MASADAGYRIAPMLTKEQFENLIEIRLALEPLSASNAAARMSRSEVESLQGLADASAAIDKSSDKAQYVSFAQADGLLHAAIAEGGKNELIAEALDRLHIHVRLFRLIYNARIRTEAEEEHQKIVDAIRAGDSPLAAFEMRQHILRSADRFRMSFSKLDHI
jgi:DNA-binding GntR family transcriptional regulator